MAYQEKPDEAVPLENDIPPLPGFESTNVWPDEAAETAFLAESRAEGDRATPPAEKASEESRVAAAPSLDELVERIPRDARELLDELFRARFTTVRKVQPRDLKA